METIFYPIVYILVFLILYLWKFMYIGVVFRTPIELINMSLIIFSLTLLIMNSIYIINKESVANRKILIYIFILLIIVLQQLLSTIHISNLYYVLCLEVLRVISFTVFAYIFAVYIISLQNKLTRYYRYIVVETTLLILAILILLDSISSFLLKDYYILYNAALTILMATYVSYIIELEIHYTAHYGITDIKRFKVVADVVAKVVNEIKLNKYSPSVSIVYLADKNDKELFYKLLRNSIDINKFAILRIESKDKIRLVGVIGDKEYDIERFISEMLTNIVDVKDFFGDRIDYIYSKIKSINNKDLIFYIDSNILQEVFPSENTAYKWFRKLIESISGTDKIVLVVTGRKTPLLSALEYFASSIYYTD